MYKDYHIPERTLSEVEVVAEGLFSGEFALRLQASFAFGPPLTSSRCPSGARESFIFCLSVTYLSLEFEM
jgi:hypothetical protein